MTHWLCAGRELTKEFVNPYGFDSTKSPHSYSNKSKTMNDEEKEKIRKLRAQWSLYGGDGKWKGPPHKPKPYIPNLLNRWTYDLDPQGNPKTGKVVSLNDELTEKIGEVLNSFINDVYEELKGAIHLISAAENEFTITVEQSFHDNALSVAEIESKVSEAGAKVSALNEQAALLSSHLDDLIDQLLLIDSDGDSKQVRASHVLVEAKDQMLAGFTEPNLAPAEEIKEKLEQGLGILQG